MSKALSLLRRHAAPVIAVLLVTGGAAAAVGVAAQSSKDPSQRIYACVHKKTNDMQLAKASKRCPRGWDKIAWNAKGPAGAAGPSGADGTNAPANSAYVYNTDWQVVAIEADVLFDTNGLLSSGFTHQPGSATMNIVSAGRYDVRFVVSGVEPNQFTLFVNGLAVPGSTYGSGAGTQQTSGQVLIDLAAGDVLTLRNHSSASAVTLQSVAGGTQANVNASIRITQVA